MLGGDLSSALFAPPLFTLFLASFLLVAVRLSPGALPDLTLLPLDGFRTRVSSKLRLQLYHASPDGVTLPTGLIALWPLSPLGHDAVYSWGDKNKVIKWKLCRVEKKTRVVTDEVDRVWFNVLFSVNPGLYMNPRLGNSAFYLKLYSDTTEKTFLVCQGVRFVFTWLWCIILTTAVN